MVEDGAFSYKIDYVIFFQEILNPEGHPNCITVSKVTVIFLNWWILPGGGASAVNGLCLQPAQQACFLTYKSGIRETLNFITWAVSSTSIKTNRNVLNERKKKKYVSYVLYPDSRVAGHVSHAPVNCHKRQQTPWILFKVTEVTTNSY